jgi:hypothetical protein
VLARGGPNPNALEELLAHVQVFPDPYSAVDPSALSMQVFRLASGSPTSGGELVDMPRAFLRAQPHPYARIAIDDLGGPSPEEFIYVKVTGSSRYTGSYVLLVSGGVDDCCAPPPTGHLRVCKQAADGVVVGPPFSFRMPTPGDYGEPPGELAFTVPAGSCSEPLGPRPLHPLTVTEDPSPGVETLAIATTPPDRLLASDPEGRSALVQVGRIVPEWSRDTDLTEVTFTNGVRPADLSVEKACTAGPVAPGMSSSAR